MEISNIPIHHLMSDELFYIKSLDDCPESCFNIPHKHDFYEIMIFESKGTSQQLDFKAYDIQPNSIFFIAPGQVHEIANEQIKGSVIAFSEQMSDEIGIFNDKEINHLFKNFAKEPFILTEIKEFERLNTIRGLIQDEFDTTCDYKIIRSLLRTFLLCCSKIKSPKPELAYYPHSERINEFFSLLEKHFREEKKASFYSERMNLTAKRLNEVLKNELGKTITDLVHERLILEAKREINFSSRSVKEIAYSLGYKDPAFFNRFFKKKTGVTPLQFKDQMFK